MKYLEKFKEDSKQFKTWCLQVWKVWKKSEILKVGQEFCKKSGNFTNISKKFGKKP